MRDQRTAHTTKEKLAAIKLIEAHRNRAAQQEFSYHYHNKIRSVSTYTSQIFTSILLKFWHDFTPGNLVSNAGEPTACSLCIKKHFVSTKSCAKIECKQCGYE